MLLNIAIFNYLETMWVDYGERHAPFILLALAIVATALIFDRIGTMRTKRRVPMNARERRDYVRQEVADLITNGLEEKIHQDKLTREEVQRWYKQLSSLGLGELLPKSIPERQCSLKEKIYERLGLASHDEVKKKLLAQTPKSKLDAILMR